MGLSSVPQRLARLRLPNPAELPPPVRYALVGLLALSVVATTLVLGERQASAAAYTVSIKNLEFTPATVNVAVGDTITWVNQESDNTNHDVTGAWDSPELRPGQRFTVTATTAGTFDYYCRLHPYMTGRVVVGQSTTPTTTATSTAAPTTAPTTGTPTAAPTTTPPTGGGPTTTATSTAAPTTGTPTAAPTTTSPSEPPALGRELGDGTRLATYELVDGVKVFRLQMAQTRLEVSPGVFRDAYAFNGIVPGPVIRVREGDRVRMVVENRLPEHTGVHWHGMELPNSQDGVPDITQPHIEPGQTYTYEWTAKATGTHWYHSHMGGDQVGKGLYGSLEVVPLVGDIVADRDYRLLIGDGSLGFTFNGRSYPGTVPLRARAGEKVRIRLIGTGPEQLHPIHLHGKAFKVVAQDGRPLPAPYEADTLTVAPGQTFDIVVTFEETGHWMLHCHVFSHSEGPHGMTGLVTTVEIDPPGVSLPPVGDLL